MLLCLFRHVSPATVLPHISKWTTLRWSSTSAKTSKHHEPLRVLFCGADAFSIYSLHALHKLQQRRPDKIASIDVVCRPDKRVGRGLKKVQEVPIKPIATALSLPLHQIDTFTSWTPPPSTNLIITVSFGLLVPARILKSATHGGLNIHPSLLPDLRGPAPLQNALLRRRSHTGVSLQTMHPTKFDHGVVLAQTPAPGIRIEDDATPESLLEVLGPMGAEILVRGIEDGVFVPPLRDVSGGAGTATEAEAADSQRLQLAHAPKISPADREINWASWTAEEILLRDRALGGRLWDGGLWARAGLDEGQWDEGKQQKKFLRATFAGPWRVIAAAAAGEAGGTGREQQVEAGKPFLALDPVTGNEEVRFATVDGKAVVPTSITQESGRKGQGAGLLAERLRGGGGD